MCVVFVCFVCVESEEGFKGEEGMGTRSSGGVEVSGGGGDVLELEESVEQLSVIFEGTSRKVLREVLVAHSGDLERTVEYLVAGGDRGGAGRLEDDEAYARRLQEEMYAEYERGRLGTGDRHRGSSGRFYVRDSTRSSRSGSAGGRLTSGFNFDDLNSEQVEVVVTNIKEIVVPALQEQISGVEFPPVENSTDKLNFELRRVSVYNFAIPLDQVEVKLSGGAIDIKVVNVDIELEVGSWRYERMSLPRIKDTGSARATLKDVNVRLIVIEGQNYHQPLDVSRKQSQYRAERSSSLTDPTHSYVLPSISSLLCDHFPSLAPLPDLPMNLQVRECHVEIGKVILKTSETKRSWLYNLLAVVFRPVLKSSAEQVLKQSIVEAVQDQAGDWGTWVNG